MNQTESSSPPPIRLTQLAKRAGCAAKQPPGYLLPLLGALPALRDPRVLVGSATADDAAVYRLNDELALILTTDFFTPIVDDPGDFGAVAAANALSDVYAMGGKPLAALSIVGFPDDKLPPAVLGAILRGAADLAAEAGIDIVGGHTIKAEEPIFGLAVVGTVHPARVVTNAGAKPGNRLVLTKPLGLGIISTAAKNGQDSRSAITEAIALMKTLNRTAAEVLSQFPLQAMTDVTGFGLLGHLRNLTAASRVRATVWVEAVPVLPAAAGVSGSGDRPRRHARQPPVLDGAMGQERGGRDQRRRVAAVRRPNLRRAVGLSARRTRRRGGRSVAASGGDRGGGGGANRRAGRGAHRAASSGWRVSKTASARLRPTPPHFANRGGVRVESAGSNPRNNEEVEVARGPRLARASLALGFLLVGGRGAAAGDEADQRVA
jgi:selenide,water dikinase